jgi:ParB/RepB/Spo0J family partition protein
VTAPAAPRAFVPIERVHPNPDNIRDELRDLDELVESIRAVGVLQDLLVTPNPVGELIILDGHRRREASRRAGLKVLPVVGKRVKDADDHIIVMLATGKHQQLTPLEEARGFRILRDRGVPFADIGRRTGHTAGYVRDRLALLRLPDEAKDLLRTGRLTTTAAIDLARAATTGQDRTVPARAPGARTAWFGPSHRLAGAVRELCQHRGERQIIAGTGCGPCWEKTIHDDATGALR